MATPMEADMFDLDFLISFEILVSRVLTNQSIELTF